MSVMNVVETDNVEVLQLMNTSTTDNVSVDQIDASLASVSTTTLQQTGNIFICFYVIMSAFCCALACCYAN